MKRILLALSTLLFAYSGFTQRYDPSADINPTSFTVGFNYNPSFNYRTYRIADPENAFYVYIKEAEDSINSAMPMSNFGLSMTFELSRSFSLEVGANAGDRGYRITKLVEPNNVLHLYKLSNVYRFVNIPLKARIYFNQGPTQFYAAIGASAGFITALKQTSIEVTDDFKVKRIVHYKDENIRRFNASAILGFGFRTYVGKRGVLSFEPSFNRSLLNLNKDEDFKIRLYQVCMSVGYSIEFN
jgi:hypothetical protein